MTIQRIEHKFIDLKDLKMTDDGPGEISGYRSVYGVLDEGGDVVVKGAFADCIPEYLHSGFTAHSHDWSFSEAVGFPIAAIEDDYGWKVTSQFHGTPDAQNIRQKAKERMDAGKQVGFSFGYKADEFQFIEQKDFKDQLPQFIKPDQIEETLRKAQKFSRVRILKKVSAVEDSLVTVGMNRMAAATGVKSGGGESLSEPTVMTKEELEDLRKAVGAIDLPLAALDHVWDSSANEKAVREFAKATDAPNADYAKSFLYVAEDGGDKFGDYALAFGEPFKVHEEGKGVVGTELKAVPKRIVAVAERLDAMEISDEAKAAIKTKIDGYFASMRSEFKDETIIAPWAKATATECTCCANDTMDCGCATKDKTTAGTCSCHADCAKCMTAKCAGLAATAAAGGKTETIESLTEKVNQLMAKIEAETEGKAGARNSSSDKKQIAKIHDASVALEPSVCGSMKSVTVSDQVKGMYEDALAEMTTPTVWQVYYAFLEVLDMIEDLPDSVGAGPVDKPALVEEAIQAMVTAMREAALAKLDEPEVEYVFYGAAPESFKTLSSDLVSEPFDVHNLAVVTAVREIATRSGAIKMAVDALIDRANEKQEFRNADGRPVSALIRARKADIDKGLKDARENIAEAAEKSESLTLLEPEDLSVQMRAQMLRTQRLRSTAHVS